MPYHNQPPPKSLGVEWLHQAFWPVLEQHEHNGTLVTEDLLATAVAHIAAQVRSAANGRKTLVTGGGAFNDELVLRFGEASPIAEGMCLEAIVPDATSFKEKKPLRLGFWGSCGGWNGTTSGPKSQAAAGSQGGALWGKNGLSSPSPNAMQ